ncbi:hypothetical protein [Hymenobacter sp. BT188]|uniref:hypothetical protein n=1 Tax=Hymenobacter sp. BT188 TaxID=2763504 RepID=UPI001650D60D|nr:hypothetical protein [Hymenobacter sp. BT188]
MLLSLLATSCRQQEQPAETCENFQVGGLFYQGEQVRVTFNSTVIYTDSFPEKSRLLLERLCLAYTDTFTVQVRITTAKKVVLDTVMVGHKQQGHYVLFVPRGLVRHPVKLEGLNQAQQMALYDQVYKETPKDSLRRMATLQPGLIVTD